MTGKLPAKIAVWCLAALFACAAVYLFINSGLSFNALRAVALAAVPPGYDDRFTLELYSQITSGLRLMALLLALVSILLTVFAERLSRALFKASKDVMFLGRRLAWRTAALKHDRLHLVTLLAILLASVMLRLAFLGEPIRNDESYTFMYYASRPIYVALTYYTVNNHMLNTLLMHISTEVFGPSVWAVRLPTMTAGILLVPATYAAMRLYHSKNAALLAAALVSVSSPLIEYSFNARGYSFGALFFILMIVFAGLIEERFLSAWYFLPVMASLALYSVPTMMYGVSGVFLYLLLRRVEWRKTVVAIACTGLLTAVFYAPVIFTVGPSAVTNNRWVIPVPRSMWASQFGRELVSLWIYWNLDLPRVVAVLLALGVLAALCSPKDLSLPPIATLLCVVFVAGALLPLQRLVPFRRTWLFLLPLCFACAAVGLDILVRKLRYSDVVSATLAVILAGWMGGTVLSAKSLRHSGIEAAGGRDSEAIVLAMKNRLLSGAQFVCADSFDSALDFEMYIHKISYQPSPDGDLLIVTPAGKSPERTLSLARISPRELDSVRQIEHYDDQDVYLGVRGPTLPFQPRGSTWMGEFKSTGLQPSLSHN